MIPLDKQTQVICATCGLTAYRQELPVKHHGQGGHQVVYETHDPSLSSPDHQAALRRMDEFFSRVHALQKQLNQLAREDRIVGQGEFIGFDFGPVRPDACNVREDVVPLGDFRIVGQVTEIALPPRPIDRIEPDSLMAEFISAVSERLD